MHEISLEPSQATSNQNHESHANLLLSTCYWARINTFSVIVQIVNSPCQFSFFNDICLNDQNP